jgi:hypothetical protein
MKAPYKKGFFAYFIPYAFLLLLLYAVYVFSQSGIISFTSDSPLFLEAEKGSVRVLLKGTNDFKEVPLRQKIQLYAGDSVRTTKNAQARIYFAEDSFVFLDEETSLSIEKYREKDALVESEMILYSGKILASVKRMINPKSYFFLRESDLLLQSRSGVFSYDTKTLQTLEGRVQIDRMDGNSVLSSRSIELGQMLTVNTDGSKILPEKEILSSEVYASPWLANALERKNVSVSIPEEQKDIVRENEEDTEENPFTKEEITSPFSLDTLKEVYEGEPVEITGRVKNAVSVSVNGYTLSQFVPEKESFVYRAKKEWGNLQEGTNEYTITAQMKDGTTESQKVSLFFSETGEKPEKVEEETEEITEKPSEVVSEKEVSLAVTNIVEGALIKEDPVEIQGTTPRNTAKIIINDYQLQTFKKGDTTWKYRASTAFENLSAGKNSFLIQAFDENDEEIAVLLFSFLY